MSNKRRNLFPIQIPAGDRAYLFDVKGSGEGNRYLVIGETSRNRDALNEHRILVHEDDLAAFSQAFQQIVSAFDMERTRIKDVPRNDGDSKAYDVGQIRQEHPRAYERWTDDEDDQLHALFVAGESIANIAEHFERKPGAIRSRLKKLGLDKPRHH